MFLITPYDTNTPDAQTKLLQNCTDPTIRPPIASSLRSISPLSHCHPPISPSHTFASAPHPPSPTIHKNPRSSTLVFAAKLSMSSPLLSFNACVRSASVRSEPGQAGWSEGEPGCEVMIYQVIDWYLIYRRGTGSTEHELEDYLSDFFNGIQSMSRMKSGIGPRIFNVMMKQDIDSFLFYSPPSTVRRSAICPTQRVLPGTPASVAATSRIRSETCFDSPYQVLGLCRSRFVVCLGGRPALGTDHINRQQGRWRRPRKRVDVIWCWYSN